MDYIQSVEMKDFPSYCFHYRTLGHLKDACTILFQNMGAAPLVMEGTVADVTILHDLDGLNIIRAIDSIGVVQGDMVGNQDFNCAHENDYVVSPLLNDVGHEIMPVLAKEPGDVVFHSVGGFICGIGCAFDSL